MREPAKLCACEATLFAICSHSAASNQFLQPNPLWPIRSSSRKNPARQKTFAQPLVRVMGKSSRPRAICSICSNRKTSCRSGSTGRRSCCGLKVCTALAQQTGGNKAAKLRAIRGALRTSKRVWLATDCDREGQLIGQEILEHYNYRGEVMRVLFTAQDAQTIRDAFGRAKPNTEYARLYAAAVARRQADQIYNLSLTRTATVILGQGSRRVIGVGRVKTPTLAIVCKRELEIRNFVPIAYFEIVATAKVAGGQFQMRYAPQERILKREDCAGRRQSS